jgi:arylsulfatase A-like enzyme
MDWFPTIMDLTGTKLPKAHVFDGKSMVTVLKDGEAKSAHESFYWRLGGNPDKAKWAVRKGPWKLLGNTAENVRPEGVAELSVDDRELFLANLKEDIGETTNRKKDHPKIVEELLKIRESKEKSIAGEE